MQPQLKYYASKPSEILNLRQLEKRLEIDSSLVWLIVDKKNTGSTINAIFSNHSDNCDKAYYIIGAPDELHYRAFWLNSIFARLFFTKSDREQNYTITKKALMQFPFPKLDKKLRRMCQVTEHVINRLFFDSDEYPVAEGQRLLRDKFMQIRNAMSMQINYDEFYKKHNVDVIGAMISEIRFWQENKPTDEQVLERLMSMNSTLMNQVKYLQIVTSAYNDEMEDLEI